MYTAEDQDFIRVLVADDDEHVLRCYREAFGRDEPSRHMQTLSDLAAELFDSDEEDVDKPRFDIVECSQGADAIQRTMDATEQGSPFDVIILDVRMPPGIDGVQAGSEIRKIDPDVEIVFVTGYSDVPLDELRRRVPPPMRLHYFNKPLSFTQLAEDVVTMVREH